MADIRLFLQEYEHCIYFGSYPTSKKIKNLSDRQMLLVRLGIHIAGAPQFSYLALCGLRESKISLIHA